MLIGITCLLMAVSLPHALEDFHYGDLARLGICQPLGIAMLCTAYAVQIIGLVLVVRGRRSGAVLLGAMGAVWCVGAAAIHGHDMVFGGEHYRHGMVSRLLELSIIVLGALATVLGMRTAHAMR